MDSFVIMADSACDVPRELLEQWGVTLCEMSFCFDGEDKVYTNSQMPVGEFYGKMRRGGVARTSAINPAGFTDAFEKELRKGMDVVYLGFSSGLSTTCQSALMAAQELEEKYQDRHVYVVDSLCASAGYGLLLWLTVEHSRGGASARETADFAAAARLSLCHWFTVDDLVYLKRGGRVSAAAATVAGVLNIKPVLHVDDEGHLISVAKVRGRKNSVKALADKYGELALTPGEGCVFIGHGDCLEDARELDAMLKERFNICAQRILDIGPIIGAHSGPGTLALFFLGKHR